MSSSIEKQAREALPYLCVRPSGMLHGIYKQTIADTIMDRLTAGDTHRTELKGNSPRRKTILTLRDPNAATSEAAHHIALQAINLSRFMEK